MKKILQKDEKVLRQIAKEVPLADIHTTKIKKVLTEMKEALDSQGDGVAIAAPQIGYALRIFVVSGKIFSKDFPKTREERYSDHAPKKETKEEEKEIKKKSKILFLSTQKFLSFRAKNTGYLKAVFLSAQYMGKHTDPQKLAYPHMMKTERSLREAEQASWLRSSSMRRII